MSNIKICLTALSIGVIFACACSRAVTPEEKSWDLHKAVAPVQGSVVTVAAMGADGDVLRIGSGFFIDRDGTLVTSDHVLDGALEAKVKTAKGGIFPISTVIAYNPLVDLIKVRVQIPPGQAVPLALAEQAPAIADRVLVIGSPMGLPQTISEGIVAAIRRHPSFGEVYQLTAPISPGSSGGPVLDIKGRVIGIVSFQTAHGQNINFAVAIKALQMMSNILSEPSIAEWTLQNHARDPGQAASLCRQGAQLSIKGKYKTALDYFQQAAEANPKDPHLHRAGALAPDNPGIYYDMGAIYNSRNLPAEELKAYIRAIRADPRMVPAHFSIALLFLKQGNRKLALDEYAILKDLDKEAAQRLFDKIYPDSIDKIRTTEPER